MDVNNYLVDKDNSILEVMKRIEKGEKGIAFICDQEKLLASVTDGDIRRYLIRGGDLRDRIADCAIKNPYFLYKEEEYKAEDLMKEKQITAVPILDKNNKIVSIRFLQKKAKKKLELPLVIMAGGKGTRLKPYSDILPKPLMPIGETTITEHIIERFHQYQCTKVYMIINYRKNLIKAYFKDNIYENAIHFIEEEEFLGTGGGLRLLLNENIENTFFMSNCDILIDADYADIYEHHKKSNNIITMVCAKRQIVIPYGNVEIGVVNQVIGLKEKPSYLCNINTGMYVIERKFLEKIPLNSFVHITDIIRECIKNGEKVGIYNIDDNRWLDMGQMDELKKMKRKLEYYENRLFC